jgi:glycosyltransferase involved in cell wall biosynthesis
MGYARVDLELSQPLPSIELEADQDGVGLVARREGRLIGFALRQLSPGAHLEAGAVAAIADAAFGRAVLVDRAAGEIAARWPAPQPRAAPSLSVAICTKDRATRLRRLLASLLALRSEQPFAALEVLVVDNAPSDDATRQVVQALSDVRYVLEPRAGLDFARNAALRAATGDLLAFLDDDVVVDGGWLRGLYAAWARAPDAGGYTGLVLPYRLDTEAQVQFETRGGFGRGFRPDEFRAERYGNTLHPVGAGILGAGCDMCFDRRLLLALGGFDEALDTGAPLPGGGDLDMFYRVLRSGRAMVYEPSYAVFHEHRETLAQLRHQYWTWGLGFMAFLVKSHRGDPPLRRRQAAAVWWWICDRLAAMARAAVRRRRLEFGFAWAEFRGGLQGLAGEYDRSRARSQRIREQAA